MEKEGEREEWEEGEEDGRLKVRSGRANVVISAPNGVVPEHSLGDGGGESCVYLDRDEGIWKCSHCIWTHGIGSPEIENIQDHKEYAKTLSQQGSCFGLQIKGDVSTDEIKATKSTISTGLFSGEKKLRNDEAKSLENENVLPIFGSDSGPIHMKDESKSRSLISSDDHCENGGAGFDPIRDRSVDVNDGLVEMDVERVLEDQETHDLFCPNCHSCITKRVILRKRKRIARDLLDSGKREKLQRAPQSDPEISPTATSTNALNQETGPDVFRCLSCFSFFIPIATGFKLFPTFGRSGEGESLRSTQPVPVNNMNSISSIYELFTDKWAGDETVKDTLEQPLLSSQHLDNSEILLLHPQEKQKSVSLLMPGQSLFQLQATQIGDGEKPYGEDILTSEEKSTAQNTESDMVGLPSPSSSDRTLPDMNTDPLLGAPNGHVSGKRVSEDIVELPLSGMIQPIEGMHNPDGSVPSSGIVPEIRIDMDPQRMDEDANRGWDILKSIVYGGLIESITSLGVVSSAAGSDATTLNVMVLGLANLIGGLLTIVHNLWELKEERDSSTDREGAEFDRYQALLGRGSFRLHATIAVLSYILFGLLPPLIYGFSFRKSDNKDYKLIAVAAASLLCVSLLAIGKELVRKEPNNYFRTLMYYISTAVMASGLSYAAGVLLKEFLKKFGWFDSSATAPVSSNSPFLDMAMAATKSGWASF